MPKWIPLDQRKHAYRGPGETPAAVRRQIGRERVCLHVRNREWPPFSRVTHVVADTAYEMTYELCPECSSSIVQALRKCETHGKHLTKSQRAIRAAKAADGVELSLNEAAQRYEVSSRLVERATQLLKISPELASAVDAGDVLLTTALKRACLQDPLDMMLDEMLRQRTR